MKVLLLVFSIISQQPDYGVFEKELHKEMLVADTSPETFLNEQLVKAHDKKDHKRILYLVATYHKWNCQLPLAARMKLPDSIEAKNYDDLVKMLKEKLE